MSNLTKKVGTKINKKQFDEIIKNNLASKTGADKFVYKTGDGKEYENYYSNEEFNLFVREMKEYNLGAYFKQYNDGDGGELKEKKGRYGTVPPKMASVASSSRFCYLALRDSKEDGIQFEYECKIDGISGSTAPQLDAYIPDKEIYVEVKCHEIFDSHKIIMKEKYWNYIYGNDNDFGFEPKAENISGTFEIPITAFGINKRSTMFDIKQFLCHIMGVASVKNKAEKATLVYLFFKPKSDDVSINNAIDRIFEELRSETESLFNSKPIQKFTGKHKISLKAIAEYSKTMEKLTKDNMIVLVSVGLD